MASPAMRREMRCADPSSAPKPALGARETHHLELLPSQRGGCPGRVAPNVRDLAGYGLVVADGQADEERVEALLERDAVLLAVTAKPKLLDGIALCDHFVDQVW